MNKTAASATQLAKCILLPASLNLEFTGSYKKGLPVYRLWL